MQVAEHVEIRLIGRPYDGIVRLISHLNNSVHLVSTLTASRHLRLLLLSAAHDGDDDQHDDGGDEAGKIDPLKPF